MRRQQRRSIDTDWVFSLQHNTEHSNPQMRRARADDESLTLPDRPQKESEFGLTVWGGRQTKAEVPIDEFQRPVSLPGSGSNNGLVRSSTYITSPNLLMAQPMDPISSHRLGRRKISGDR